MPCLCQMSQAYQVIMRHFCKIWSFHLSQTAVGRVGKIIRAQQLIELQKKKVRASEKYLSKLKQIMTSYFNQQFSLRYIHTKLVVPKFNGKKTDKQNSSKLKVHSHARSKRVGTHIHPLSRQLNRGLSLQHQSRNQERAWLMNGLREIYGKSRAFSQHDTCRS